MTFVWLTVVIGVFNICLGFALGIYFQGTRQAAGGARLDDVAVPLDDAELDVAFSYRSRAEAEKMGAAIADPLQVEDLEGVGSSA
jgi:hypothetical protein